MLGVLGPYCYCLMATALTTLLKWYGIEGAWYNIFCLPPRHTMHEYQPLDAAVFGPLKRNWQEACHNYVLKNPSKVVSKYTFSSLLAEAWTKTMIPSTLAAGFRKCGVYPFNLEAPRLSRKQKATTEKEQQHSLCQLTTTTEPSGKSEKEQKHSQTPIASCIPLATANAIHLTNRHLWMHCCTIYSRRS